MVQLRRAGAGGYNPLMGLGGSWAAAVVGGTWGTRGGRFRPHRAGDLDQPGGRM